jgi:hypothetical protein
MAGRADMIGKFMTTEDFYNEAWKTRTHNHEVHHANAK